MSKAQARKRLQESRNKILAVVIEGSTHLTPVEANKLWKINTELMKSIMKLK